MEAVMEKPKTKSMEILKTKDYSQFLVLEGNRGVNEKHVVALMESMKEEDCVSPIQVNEKLEVVDGQHRLNALMRMKRPVYYYIVKGASLRTVQKLNSHTKNWKTDDYLDSYVNAGNKHYIQYQGFRDMYKFGHTVNLMLLASVNYGNSRVSEEQKFKDGEFQVTKIEDAVEIAMKLEQLAPLYDKYKARSFVFALVKCIKNKKFDWKKFIHKCSYQQKKMVVCSNVDQYLDMIEEIYNYNSKKEDKLSLKFVK